jgi:hypothetical protein
MRIANPARLLIALSIISFSGCESNKENANTTAMTMVTPPGKLELTKVARPAAIEDVMKQRGEQDQAKPTLQIISPTTDSTISGSTVEVKLVLNGDLKGYVPHKDPATGKGNHIQLILDNQPYEAYYELTEPFELRNVAAGKHILRVFASRPWHEGYKNAAAFQMVEFTIEGGGDRSKPTMTKAGQIMATPTESSAAKPEAGNAATATSRFTRAREGKTMASSNAGDVDTNKPLLTYSHPQGDYAGADADPIMIDFWLTNATLHGQGGDYRVRYTIDGTTTGFIDVWEPIWLSGWTSGKHTVKLELIDKNGQVVDNGGYNSTTREINITK